MLNFLVHSGPVQVCYRECFTFGTCPWLLKGLLDLHNLFRPVRETALHSGHVQACYRDCFTFRPVQACYRNCFTFRTCPSLLQGLLYLQDMSRPVKGAALPSGTVQACYRDFFTFILTEDSFQPFYSDIFRT